MQITGTTDAKTPSRQDAAFWRFIGAKEGELGSFLEDAMPIVLRLHKFVKRILFASLYIPLCAVAALRRCVPGSAASHYFDSESTRKSYIAVRSRENHSRWWLSAILLLSVFCFSGYSGPAQPRVLSPHQTEIFERRTSQLKTRSLSYKRALASLFRDSELRVFDKRSIVLFNLATKVQADQLSGEFRVVGFPGKYFRNKVIPHHQDEDDLSYKG